MMISGKNFKGVLQQQQQQSKEKKQRNQSTSQSASPKIQQQQQQQQQIISKKFKKSTSSSINSTIPTKLVTPLKSNNIIASKVLPKEEEEVNIIINIKEKALELLSKANGTIGSIRIKFNHYNKRFPIYNTVLKWQDVDEEYSFSFVYKGLYTRDLIFNVEEKSCISLEEYRRNENNLVLKDDIGDYFINLEDGKQYYAYIIESEEGIGAEGLRISNEPLKAIRDTTTSIKSGNTQVNLITNELKSMNVKDLNNEEARKLKEARDVEDILFS